jgi:glutathione S-transferase
MEVEEGIVPLIIGYYPFRAKAQIIRLLCEYLNVPYYDRFLNPDEWSRFKEGEGKRWHNKELPFLKHGDFILTGSNAMVNYVIEVSGRTELLGKTLEHQAKIDIFRSRGCLNIILGFLCNGRLEADQLKLERIKQLNELY